MGFIFGVLLIVMFSVSYVIQNWILEHLDGVVTGWVLFGGVVVLAGLVPFILLVLGAMFAIRRLDR